MGLSAVTFQTTFMISLVILNIQGDASSDLRIQRDLVRSQFSSIKNVNSLEDVSSDLRNLIELIWSLVSSFNNGVSWALQQKRGLSRPHFAQIKNGIKRAKNHLNAASAHVFRVLPQSRDLSWPQIASIYDGIIRAENHFTAALAHVLRVLQQSRDLSQAHITSINDETMNANFYFNAALADVSRVVTSINNVEPSTAKPTESPPNEWKRPTTSSYEDEAPSTAKPTQSQPKNWPSTTTSSYKDVEFTSGTIPKTTKFPLCEPAYYSQKDATMSKIVNGVYTSISRHPYQLALEGGGSHICGGSILTEFWALTAAHCVNNQPLKWLAFRAGSSRREEGGTVHPVKYYVTHESYREKTLDYDVAVVRVRDPFRYNGRTSPITLLSHLYEGGVQVEATGWGYKQRALLTKPKQLQSADFLTLDSETCRRKYPGQITERMLCAEDPNNITDICSGDSGGALVLRGSNTLVGIVSWSHACADGRPSVYTNVSSVATWIRERVC